MSYCDDCNHDRCWKEWLEELMNEDRYEALEIIIKSREDGQSWFDIFVDLVSETCEGTCTLDENGDCTDEGCQPCTCGLESAGGMTGTLTQCYKWKENLGQGLTAIDVANAIRLFVDGTHTEEENELQDKAVRWARAEIEFEESFPWSEDE